MKIELNRDYHQNDNLTITKGELEWYVEIFRNEEKQPVAAHITYGDADVTVLANGEENGWVWENDTQGDAEDCPKNRFTEDDWDAFYTFMDANFPLVEEEVEDIIMNVGNRRREAEMKEIDILARNTLAAFEMAEKTGIREVAVNVYPTTKSLRYFTEFREMSAADFRLIITKISSQFSGMRLKIKTLDAAEYVEFCEKNKLDIDSPTSRAAYAGNQN